MTLRAVSYTRVSTKTQADEGLSLAAQLQRAREYIAAHGWIDVWHYSDAGESAYHKGVHERPASARLLVDAARGQFDVVVVWALDRATRDLEGENLYAALRRRRLGLHDVLDGEQTDAVQSVMTRGMKGLVANLESAQNRERMRLVAAHRAAKGLPTGTIPFGYRPGPDGVPVVVSAEAAAVRMVYERKAQGQSNGELAAWLNEQGFQTRRGLRFTPWAVKDLLRGRFYLGEIVHHDEVFKARHSFIINQGLYDRVQQRRGERREPWAGPGLRSPLHGLVYCGHCRGTVAADRSRGRLRFRERHGRECRTIGRGTVARVFEEQIGTILGALQLPADWRDRMLELAAQRQTSTDGEALRERRRRLVRAYADDGLAFGEAEYARRLADLNAAITATEAKSAPADLEGITSLLDDFPALWQEAVPGERRALIAPLIERIYVDLASQRIGGSFPPQTFARCWMGRSR